MYAYVLQEPVQLHIKEKKGRYKNRVQLDEIMKKLFYIHNKRPIIDLLNSLYGDNIGYNAEITYLNKEAIDEAVNREAFLISRECDMFIKVDYGGKSFEYMLEFQTKADKSIAIRLFRYSFELKVQNIKALSRSKPIVIELPKPYVIAIEKNAGVPDKYEFIIKIPTGESLKYSSKVLKFWEYDLKSLYEKNMYLLLPMKVFEVRKKINKIKLCNHKSPKYEILIREAKNDILNITKEVSEYIEILYEEGKIEDTEYNEYGVVIANLSLYVCREIDKLSSIDKEVADLIKTLYDPKVEQKGIEKGFEKAIRLTAENMIKDGDSNEKIKRCTGLDDSVIAELRKFIETKGAH